MTWRTYKACPGQNASQKRSSPWKRLSITAVADVPQLRVEMPTPGDNQLLINLRAASCCHGLEGQRFTTFLARTSRDDLVLMADLMKTGKHARSPSLLQSGRGPGSDSISREETRSREDSRYSPVNASDTEARRFRIIAGRLCNFPVVLTSFMWMSVRKELSEECVISGGCAFASSSRHVHSSAGVRSMRN